MYTPALLTDLLEAACLIAPSPGTSATVSANDAVVEATLGRPHDFDVDGVLTPALLALRSNAEVWGQASTQRLVAFCVGELERRVATVPVPPSTWSRNARLSHNCEDCAMLSRFLLAPDVSTYDFNASEARRRHIQSVVEQSNVDVHLTTVRTGSPYSLRATKNHASHERAVAACKLARQHLALLKA